MQQNSTESAAAAPNRSPDSATQQQTTNAATFGTRGAYNHRFAITPESMGMNLRSDTPTPTREQQQQPQHEPPLVDVKSYYERHNTKPMVGLLSESNASFHSSHSNTPTNSYGSIKADNSGLRTSSYCTKISSPNISPKTRLQQWNFDYSNTNEKESLEQQDNVYTSSASLCPTQYSHPSASRSLQTPKSSGNLNKTNDVARTQCAFLQNITSVAEIPISYNEQELQKYRSESDGCVGDSAKLNYTILNGIYSKRIEDINANVWGNKDLKIVTYQEWVEMLTKINESFITNMEELEREVAERLELAQRKVNSNCRHSQGNELMKCRKDIDTLLKYIKHGRKYNNWDLQDFTFETITPFQVLEAGDFDNFAIEGHGGDDMKNCSDAESLQRNKVLANMKALAHEVAEKHDEVRELKRQVICLEDEIQKAQKKIQLKDDVIKELRNDLKCANNKFSAQHSVDTSLNMPPINFENQTSRSGQTQLTDSDTPRFQDDNVSQFDSLSHTELEEQQVLKLLDEELSEFFEINNELNKQKTEIQHKKLKGIFHKLESEKAAAYRKLDFIRRQLIDLESESTEVSHNDGDSGFHSKSENDQDAKILGAVRTRLRNLNETNGELKRRLQKLELENGELSNNLKAEKSFSERNSEILKQVADLLCGMIRKQFSYTDIYNTTTSEINPFCEAILELKKDFQEKETQLLKAVAMKNKQIEELSQNLMENEKVFSEARIMHLNANNLEDINGAPTTTTLLTPTSPQPATLSTSLTGQQLKTTTSTFSRDFREK